jgi:hypothetical protein
MPCAKTSQPWVISATAFRRARCDKAGRSFRQVRPKYSRAASRSSQRVRRSVARYPQIEDFVERDNIAHYGDRLKTAADPFTRMILHDLLAGEEAKRRKGESIRSIAQVIGVDEKVIS